ncbi:zinc finger protein 771-like [Corythoichthys intestinalis]|uniref:zinc finger protein 771-like n=1 Tax=Corythoichthys intestinalis TaxID=161448 RepID=UPI0025A5F9A7|nr:zinc finger protein 771-like [Corythoichthys intestinalis]
MSDVSQAHHPECQESPRIEEEFVHIKEDQEEYFNRVENPHIEEQQQPHPLEKEGEDHPNVKVEVVDIPKWTDEPLKGEDGGPSEASRRAEPPSGSSSSSSSKEGSQADNLIARPSESDNFTSHSLLSFRKYLGAKRQEPVSPGVKEDVELPQIKEEEPEPCQHKQFSFIKEEEQEMPYFKEKEAITTLTGEPLQSEDVPSEASRGAELPSGDGGSSSSTEGLQADIFFAPSDRNDATSHSPKNDDIHKISHRDNKLCKCPQCGKTFVNKYNCRTHMRSHTGEKPFSCSVCGQRFTQKSTLNTHTRTHTGEKPFSCSVCGLTFNHKNILQIHERTHTGEKPYSCSVCGQRFSRKGNLQTHERTHTGEKPFSCSVCGQRFAQKQHLKLHTRNHTREKPFSCLFCGQRFARKGYLTQHRRTHTGEKPFSCSVCGQRFTRKSTLLFHTRTHTGENPFPARFVVKDSLERIGLRDTCVGVRSLGQ